MGCTMRSGLRNACEADILNQTLLDRPTESFQVSQIALHAVSASSSMTKCETRGAPAMVRSSRSPGPGSSGKSAQCNTNFVEAIGGGCGRLFFTPDPSNRSLHTLATLSESFGLVRHLRTAASGHAVKLRVSRCAPHCLK